MKVLVINNDGGGFANYLEVVDGIQLGEWVNRYLGDRSPSDYLIRVNRLPAAADQVLCEGDRVSITPVKIEGASAQLAQLGDKAPVTVSSRQPIAFGRLRLLYRVAKMIALWWFTCERTSARDSLNEQSVSVEPSESANGSTDHSDSDNQQQRRAHKRFARWVVIDMLALQDEFPELIVSLERQSVAVVTEEITLQGVCLGRYRVELFFSDKNALPFYSVCALEPSRSSEDDGVTHPHVCNDSLCEGEATTPLWRAIRDGRLFDFFLIVAQVLRTYNEGNCYVALEHWNWTHCSDCGELSAASRTGSCNSCDGQYCVDCLAACTDCDATHCDSCLEACGTCDDKFCSNCISGHEECCGCEEE